MDEPVGLTRISAEQTGDYHYLDRSDRCYCLGFYQSGEGFEGLGLNRMVLDLKREPGARYSHPGAWQDKREAITRVSSILTMSLQKLFPHRKITLIPVPPSKKAGDPEHDDRMLQICNLMAAELACVEVSELFVTRRSVQASHLSRVRPTKERLKENIRMMIRDDAYRPAPLVVLLDDVLTSGAHYSACKELLEGVFPAVTVVGVFVARVDHAQPDGQ